MADRLFMAGPCVLESEEIALETAGMLSSVFEGRPDVEWIFKASFLKDNRTSAGSFRGPGLERGLSILGAVRETFGVRVTTDVHESSQVEKVAGVADIIQIPAFLCRQTSLLEAAGGAGLPVNVKKGQFMDPRNMAGAVDKLRSAGCPRVMLTERGSFFGYGDLVVDFRSLSIMRPLCDSVVIDVTHSSSGREPRVPQAGATGEHAVRLARAAAAWGVDGIFFEAHPRPGESPSDRDTILGPEDSASLVDSVLRHWEGAR